MSTINLFNVTFLYSVFHASFCPFCIVNCMEERTLRVIYTLRKAVYLSFISGIKTSSETAACCLMSNSTKHRIKFHNWCRWLRITLGVVSHRLHIVH